MRYEQNTPEYDPWDSGVYRNGSTKPPKNRGGLIAILLIAVIMLCGIVTVMSFLNIRLFKQMGEHPVDGSLPIVFSEPGQTDPSLMEDTLPQEASYETQKNIHVDDSPISPENVPQEGGMSLQAIYEKVIPSVVSISCKSPYGNGTGTGVILSEDGYVVTNCHVVEGAQDIQVILYNNTTLQADMIGTDEISDLAVLRIFAENLIPAELGDSSVLRVGDLVVAIGDPLGIALRGTMTDGIVSAINRDMEMEGRTMSLIQTNAALNSGNSGGPLINCYGQVVGINTMKMSASLGSGDVEGLGFAIPSVTVEDIVNQLILQGFVSGRPDLGISGERVSSFHQLYYRLPQGLYITEVREGSAADAVGIAVDDILIAIDNTVITSSEVLKTVLYGYAPGDQVQLLIYRGGRQYSVTVTLGEATN